MGTGRIGNLWRAKTHRRRIALVSTIGLVAVAGALVFPFSALSHDASDFFIYSRAELTGAPVKSNETNCDGSNDKQADLSGSGNTFHGRIHSNADLAVSGAPNTFNNALTYGTADEDCQLQAHPGATYPPGSPAEVDSDPSNVNNQWPGDLSTYLNGDTITFGTSITQVFPDVAACDVGSLTNTSDIVLTSANDGDVVCNGTGKTSLAISGLSMSITIVSHGLIEVSGQNATLRPAVHNVLTWTDHQLDVATKLAGSNLSVPRTAILFAPRGGINTSGSDDSELCIQLIGQGPINVAGSNSTFGPGSGACTETGPQLPNIKVSKVGNGTIDPGPGVNAQFTIDITNEGPGAATNVSFTQPDVLPNAGLTWSIASQGIVSPATPGNACSITNDQLTCSIPSLADDATYRVVVTSPTTNAQCGDKPNTVTVQAGNEAPNSTGDNTDSDTIVIRCPGNIIVQKVVVPNTDQTEFEFDTSYGANFFLGHGDSNNSGPLMPGTYSVAELVPAGWDLDNVNCNDGSPRNAIQLGSGETVTCVFTNTKRGKIIVDKNTVPAGDPQSFDFSLTGGPDAVNQGFSLTHAATPHDSGLIKPGGYSVAETVPAGWTLSSATCSDGSAPGAIALGAGETVTCTFTNTKAARIIVVKQTDPDGDPQSFTFNASYDADGFSLTDGQQNDSGPLTAGQYSVSENVPAGWDLESATCSDNSPVGAIVLSAGETVTCTFTNEKDAKIIVEKQTNPDGSTQVFTFNASYDNDGFSLTDGQQNNSGDLDPGTYSVSENVPAGWSVDNVNCSDNSPRNAIQLAAGETVTCVFTNSIQPGKIIVVKQTNPDGDPQSFSFNASYDNDGFSLTDGQSNDSGPLNPGQYSVSENVPAGWDLESATCNDGSPVNAIVLAANETVTCTFTNEKDANIVVVKQTDPDGDPQVFTFNASYDADGFSLSDGQSNDSGDLDPGTYSVSENVPAGWDLESATCSDQSAVGAISLQAGETVTCTFTNEKDARIVVVKQTNPDGDTQTFNFTASYDANGFSLTDGQSNNSGDLDPGTYSVSETVPAGWDLVSATCSDQSLPSAISLQAGEVVTCTFNNEKDARIVVVKQTNPDGDPQSFTFAASYDADGFSLTDGQSNNSGDLDPGTYSVSETVPAGWDLTSATCSDQSPVAAISLQAGEVVTCTFNNEKDAKIVVVKQTNPDGDPTQFTFAASYDADGFVLSDGQSNDSGDLDPGTYSVSETVPAGWDLQSATCSDQSPVAAISLQAGETVTCTFNNVKDAFIIVEKQTDPEGDPQVFTFNASYDNDGFSLSDNQQNNSGDLDPGTYSVSENVPAGWALESAICSDQSPVNAISLQAGETVTCVFTNEKDAKIIVEKQTDPNGHAQVFTFNASYDADGFSLSDGQQNNSGDLDPGTYSVSENVPAGWELTSATCSDQSPVNAISLQAGETITCTFNNTLLRGRIIVEKQTNPADDPQVFSFSASYDADGFTLTDNAQNDSGPLLPDTYSVSETVPAGWELESAVCSDGSPASAIALGADETVTCVFTNEKDARIIVEKQTNPANDPTEFDFTASYDENGFSLADNDQNDSGDLDPGTYSVAETVPQGWDLTSATCDDQSSPASISLQAGEVVTCTFNNEKDSKIIVEKQTLPAGDPQSFHFDADYDEGGFNLIDNQQNDSGDLDPGQYTVSEDVPEGWKLTDVECDAEVGSEGSAVFIDLGAGDVVTCVFTNTKLGSIIVEKQTVPDGAQATFNYTGDAAGSIGDNGQIVVDELLPGTYTSIEGAAPGWSLTSIICNDANSTGAIGTRTATFRLEAGEIVKCTFTNSEIPVVSGQGALDVQKSANPTSVKEPGGPVEFSVTITNTSNVPITVDNVVDSVFGDLDDSGGNGCFDVPVNLNPGQSVNCTFTRQITGPGGSAHVNVVTVDGHDGFGHELKDTDDARVDITPRLIDLVIVKTATSPTPLNGIVNYTMNVTNKGPDPATNVQLADPAPNGIVYLTANPSQGTCNVAPALITCSLGTINPGQTVTIGVTARATLVGTHTNVATVTGGGGRETNPADNVDDAVTVVPAPQRPPTARPQPPAPVCLTLTVSPKMIKADGKPDTVRVRVTAGKKRMKGTKVTIFGSGVRKTGRSNGQGIAVIRINPRRAGLITITAIETNQRVCGPKRIGVVGVFLPPLTG